MRREPITLDAFIATLQAYFPTVEDPENLKRVLLSTVGVFDTILHDKSVNLNLDRLRQAMAGIITSLNQAPGETIIHREVVKALKDMCCSQWPDQCGTSCD